MKKIYFDLKKCLACRSCEIACALVHSKTGDIYKALEEKERPQPRIKVRNSYGYPFALVCQHCELAPCVTACMSGAMAKDKKTGATTHDADRCVGCWMCIMACPLGGLTRKAKGQVILKCDLCLKKDIPACVAACPTKALFLGDEDEFKKAISKKRK